MFLRVKSSVSLLILLGLVAVSFYSCTQAGEALTDRFKRQNDAEINTYIDQNNLRGQLKQTEVGTYYILSKPNASGQGQNVGDEVQYHYIARRLDGLIVDSTEIAANTPLTVISGVYAGITAGLYDGIVNGALKKGEEAILLVPSYLDNGRVGTLLLPQYSPIRYDVRIVNIRTEEQQIQDYITANKIAVTTTTTNGVRIAITKAQPDSALVKTGQTVSVTYTGKLLNGTQFDSNTSTTSPFSYQVGSESVIAAWNAAFPLVREGEKFIMILPSSQGYGIAGRANSTGGYTIPPYAPLVFEIEVLSAQ